MLPGAPIRVDLGYYLRLDDRIEIGDSSMCRPAGSGPAARASRAATRGYRIRFLVTLTVSLGPRCWLPSDMLCDFGVDSAHPAVRAAVDQVRELSTWEYAGEPFLDAKLSRASTAAPSRQEHTSARMLTGPS